MGGYVDDVNLSMSTTQTPTATRAGDSITMGDNVFKGNSPLVGLGIFALIVAGVWLLCRKR